MGVFKDLLGTFQSTFTLGKGTTSRVVVDTARLTAARTQYAPDKDGTIAVTKDVTDFEERLIIENRTAYLNSIDGRRGYESR